jgi:hypothetical protein
VGYEAALNTIVGIGLWERLSSRDQSCKAYDFSRLAPIKGVGMQAKAAPTKKSEEFINFISIRARRRV